MIAQLNSLLWEDVFKDISVDREEVIDRISMVWDRPDGDKFCSLGVFALKNRKYLLTVARYDEDDCSWNSMTVNWYFATERAKNREDALMEFLLRLTKNQKELLQVHLYLRHHPAYQG